MLVIQQRHSTSPYDRRGLSIVEVVVVFAILSCLFLGFLMSLPRQRENARMSSCRMNMMQIGLGLAFYDRSTGALPSIPTLDEKTSASTASPLLALLESLSLPDLTSLKDIDSKPQPIAGSVPGERFVIGFACPADPYGLSDSKVAPISYRATAGDQTSGMTGPFAPGRFVTVKKLEAGDGQSFTAGFSERLIGDSKSLAVRSNYAVSRKEVQSSGCPKANQDDWRGDAGSSWRDVGWRSTLYNHALTPNSTASSCIAEDGSTALMGSSSGHIAGVNVLMLDGAVRTVTPTIEPHVWESMATIAGGTAN